MRSNEEMANLFLNANGGEGPDVVEETGGEALLKIMLAKQAQEKANRQMVEAVRQARQDNIPWQQIGDILHLSRQAVHSKFAAKISELSS